MVFLAITAALCLLLFAHPYLTYPATLRLFRERPTFRDAAAPPLSATMMFSAHDEERSLPAKIENLRAIRALHPEMQMLAYSDCSADGTLALLEGERDYLTVIAGEERMGKATGMRRMIAVAEGEICIFTDANVIIEPRSIAPLLACFSDPEVGGVAGALHYVNDGASATARVGSLYWRLEERLKERESRCGSIIGADGAIFAIRRVCYTEVSPHLLDDMTVSTSLIIQGRRLIHATDVIAYEKNATSSRDEFQRKRRIACRALNTHRHLWPAIRRSYSAGDLYKYLSHKLLRWFGLVPLALFVLSASGALLAAGRPLPLVLLSILAIAGYGLGTAGVPPFSTLSEALRSIVATFIGAVDSFRGLTYQTWQPAKSRD